MVPTSSGNHGKPGKSPKKVPCMGKSWNLEKKLNFHGKIIACSTAGFLATGGFKF